MPIFSYRAIDEDNREVRGSIEAMDRDAAVAALNQLNLEPVEVTESSRFNRIDQPASSAETPVAGTEPAGMFSFVFEGRDTQGNMHKGTIMATGKRSAFEQLRDGQHLMLTRLRPGNREAEQEELLETLAQQDSSYTPVPADQPDTAATDTMPAAQSQGGTSAATVFRTFSLLDIVRRLLGRFQREKPVPVVTSIEPGEEIRSDLPEAFREEDAGKQMAWKIAAAKKKGGATAGAGQTTPEPDHLTTSLKIQTAFFEAPPLPEEVAKRKYAPLLLTVRLYFGWLLAWYGLFVALGYYSFVRKMRLTIPIVEGFFLSPLIFTFVVAIFLYLLFTLINRWARAGAIGALTFTLVGVGLFFYIRSAIAL